MVVPRTIKNTRTIKPSNFILGYILKKTESSSRRDVSTPMFTAALFAITKTWKQPKCPSTDEWISKMRHIHTLEYYLALKRKKILQYATTWMDLEDIMLSKISQSQKKQILCGSTYMRYLRVFKITD